MTPEERLAEVQNKLRITPPEPEESAHFTGLPECSPPSVGFAWPWNKAIGKGPAKGAVKGKPSKGVRRGGSRGSAKRSWGHLDSV